MLKRSHSERRLCATGFRYAVFVAVFLMIASGYALLIHVGSENVAAAGTVRYWNATAPGGASTAAAWEPAGVPVSGDSVVFDSHSSYYCSWNLPAGTWIKDFTIIGNASATDNAAVEGTAAIQISGDLSVSSAHATYTYSIVTTNILQVNGSVTLGTRGKIGATVSGQIIFGNYTQNGASSVFTQGTSNNVLVSGDTIISDGTLTGSSGSWWVNSGSFSYTGGTITTNVLRLALTGSGTISLYQAGNFNALNISGTYTNLAADYLLTTFNTYGQYPNYVGLTGTLATNTVVILGISIGGSNVVISGTQTGTGAVWLRTQATTTIPAITATIANLHITSADYSVGSKTLTMAGNIANTGNLSVRSEHASNTLTLSHGSNYLLTATGDVTLGNRGIMTQGTGTWTFGSYTQTGVSSVFTHARNVVVNGDTTVTAGTLTTYAGVYDWYQIGNFTIGAGASLTTNVIRLVMNQTDSSLNIGVSSVLNSIIFNADVTVTSDLRLGTGKIYGLGRTVTCMANWDSMNGTFTQNASTVISVVLNGGYAKLAAGQQFHNLTINATGSRLFVATGDSMRAAGNLTVNSGCSVSLQNHSYVMQSVVNDGTITQNGKRLNITGSSTTPLMGYGTFDGDIYLNGSVASSYEVQTGLPMGNLYTDRDTEIGISSTQYLRVIPSTTEFISIKIDSYGTELGYDARWTADSTGPVTYSIKLAPNQLYEAWVDQTTRIGVYEAGPDGIAQFTYSGPFSAHSFVIQDIRSLPCKLWVSFTYSIDGLKVEFVDTTYAQPTFRIWSFGDGWGSTSPHPTHKFERSGVYTVTLTVFDEYGHSSDVTTVIEVQIGPSTPLEKTGTGWRIYISENTVIFVSAYGLGVGGAMMIVSTFYLRHIPVVTVRARRLLGSLMILACVYFLVFVKGIIDFGG